MNKHFRYLSYIVRHKYFVFVAGLKCRAPLLRLLVHDWSKFTPAEWRPYADYFYGKCRFNCPRKNPTQCSSCAAYHARFEAAWLHHLHHNPHHHQYWVLRNDDGSMKTLPIPEAYMREMVADWMGAGRAITGGWGVAAWYVANKSKMIMDKRSRYFVEELIERVTGINVQDLPRGYTYPESEKSVIPPGYNSEDIPSLARAMRAIDSAPKRK